MSGKDVANENRISQYAVENQRAIKKTPKILPAGETPIPPTYPPRLALPFVRGCARCSCVRVILFFFGRPARFRNIGYPILRPFLLMKSAYLLIFYSTFFTPKIPRTYFVTHCVTMCYSGAGRGGGFLIPTFVKKMLKNACAFNNFYYFCIGKESDLMRIVVKIMISFVFSFHPQNY